MKSKRNRARFERCENPTVNPGFCDSVLWFFSRLFHCEKQEKHVWKRRSCGTGERLGRMPTMRAFLGQNSAGLSVFPVTVGAFMCVRARLVCFHKRYCIISSLSELLLEKFIIKWKLQAWLFLHRHVGYFSIIMLINCVELLVNSTLIRDAPLQNHSHLLKFSLNNAALLHLGHMCSYMWICLFKVMCVCVCVCSC